MMKIDIERLIDAIEEESAEYFNIVGVLKRFAMGRLTSSRNARST